jgi:hypothetical protein
LARPLAKKSIVDIVGRIGPKAGIPLIVCACGSTTAQDGGTFPLWAFRESARSRLWQRWAGELTLPEFDELIGRLRERASVWMGAIDTLHEPPSRRFRLVWTLPPAPCRIYTRRGLATEVDSALVTRHLLRHRTQFPVRSSGFLEGWITWSDAGIYLKEDGREDQEVVRLKNPGLFTQYLLMYDGIDLLVDTSWLDSVVPRVADVLGLEWKIVDYTTTPPQIDRQSGNAPAPATSTK